MAETPSNFPYDPALSAAIIFLVGFTVVTAWHIFVIVQKRTYYFVPLVCGGLLEIAGYASRTAAVLSPREKPPYIVQLACILVAPALLAASLYMVFGRLAVLVRGGPLALVRPAWTTRIFVGADVACFVIQVVGAASINAGGGAGSADSFRRGRAIVLAGLMAQLAVFGFFVVAAAVFHRRLAKDPTPAAQRLDAARRHTSGWGWQRVMVVVYLTGGLIFLRSLFRFIEFSGSRDGPLMSHEVYLYIFDSLLMLAVLFILVLQHPAGYVPSKRDMTCLLGNEIGLA